jgi:hypothetical protein
MPMLRCWPVCSDNSPVALNSRAIVDEHTQLVGGTA